MSVNQFTRVCPACEVELRVKQNGVVLVECATFGFLSLRRADLHHCPVCGTEVVLGAGEEFFGHWEGDIVAEVRRLEGRGERVILCWLNKMEKDEFLRRGREAQEKARLGL